MHDDPSLHAELERDPVEELAEEFLQRRRRGEAVSISEYAEAHPGHSARIRDLFPTLLLMEELKPGPSPSSASDAEAAPPGQVRRLGDFRILREIGRGGMGVVYEAEQESLGRRVALKLLPPAYVASPTRLRRFLREAQAAARLHHTNIIPVFGVGQQEGIHYYVMQFIPGQGLDQVLHALRSASAPQTAPGDGDLTVDLAPPSPGPWSAAEAARMLQSGLPTPMAGSGLSGPPAASSPSDAPSDLPAGQPYWRSVARIGVQVAEALEYAHRQGTLHRDIKPANLLLDRGGTVWIADFGLAKLADLDDLTHSGDLVGTLRYMAPEQFEGKADARSDVYSLGLTLYELLTLRPAFAEEDRRRLLQQVAEGAAPRPRRLNPAIPRDLETIVLKAIAGHPEHRYQTAGELAADLRRFLEDRPIHARRVSAVSRAWRWCRRNRAVAALAGTALALLVAVAVVASVGYLRTNRALERVSIEREQAEDARRQAEAERTRTMAEHQRAEANLRLATRAFEDLFGQIAPDVIAQLAETDEEEAWPGPVFPAVVTAKDAALLETMLRFYDQFAQQNQADARLQKETARAYRCVGDIQRRLGQQEKAESAYRRALATYQAIADASPEKSDARTAIAAIHNELGLLFRSGGRFSEATKSHQEALAILRSEPPQAAALAEGRFELARTYGFLSASMPPGPRWNGPGRRAGRPMFGRGWDPEENNRRAVEILDELIRQSPENPRYRLAMARTQRDRSWISAFNGRRDEAEQARQEAIRRLERLVADVPGDPEYRYELAETYCMPLPRFGERQSRDDVQEHLRRAVEIGSELVTRYPTVPEYRASVARSHTRLAEASRSADLASAREHLERAIELQQALIDEFPSVLSYRFFLARSLHQLTEIDLAARDHAKARTVLEKSIANLEKLLEAAPAAPPVRMMLAGQYASLAKLSKESGLQAEADRLAAKAAELGPRRGPPGFGPVRDDRDKAAKPE